MPLSSVKSSVVSRAVCDEDFTRIRPAEQKCKNCHQNQVKPTLQVMYILCLSRRMISLILIGELLPFSAKHVVLPLQVVTQQKRDAKIVDFQIRKNKTMQHTSTN